MKKRRVLAALTTIASLVALGSPSLCELHLAGPGGLSISPNKFSVINVTKGSSVGFKPSIAFDPLGNPRVSYYDTDNASLVYARSSDGGGTWKNETVDASNLSTICTSLALDSKGDPRIAYSQYAGADPKKYPGGLRYAYWDDSGKKWNTVVVSSTSHYSVSLVLDSKDNPHILYDTSMYGGAVVYASSPDGGSKWIEKTVDSASGKAMVGWPVSLALDAQGNPHVSYSYRSADQSVNVLRHARSTDGGTKWTKTTVDSTKSFFSDSSIALDASGDIYIAYSASTQPSGANIHAVKCAISTNKGKSWDVDTVETVYGYGEPEVRLFGGVPFIVYIETVTSGKGSVNLAHRSNNTWIVDKVVTKSTLTYSKGVDPSNVAFNVSESASTAGIVFVDNASGTGGDFLVYHGIEVLRGLDSTELLYGPPEMWVNPLIRETMPSITEMEEHLIELEDALPRAMNEEERLTLQEEIDHLHLELEARYAELDGDHARAEELRQFILDREAQLDTWADY